MNVSPLTTPVPLCESSIPSEDLSALQYLYSSDTDIFCGSIKLGVLARMFARMYGPSIAHTGIRYMIIAHLVSKSGLRTTEKCPTLSEQRYVTITVRELAQKVSHSTEVNRINESDIFVAYMLAMWFGNINSTTTEAHVRGVIAFMRHLSTKMGHLFTSSPMAPLWALLRDEILWLIRKSNNCHRICQNFRDILGPKTIQQRQRYESELQGATIKQMKYPKIKVFFGRFMHTSVHTLIESAKIIDQCHPLQLNSDPLIESVFVELYIQQHLVEEKRHEPHLSLELNPLEKGDYVDNYRVERTVIDRMHDLLIFHVCRVATIALKAPSIQQGLRSSEGISAIESLTSHICRSNAFLLSGIQDGRVFGTGTRNELLIIKWLTIVLYRSW